MPVGKSRQLTDFEKNLKEEIYKRDNHIENSVKYAIDTGQDYGVSKDTPQWRRDAINKYRDSHKVEIYDDNGNLVGTVGYEAHKAINKNKVFDYKGKNDEEKKVFSYLRQRQNRESRKKEQREYVKNHMSNPEIEKLKFDYNPKTSMSRDEYNAERQRRKDNKDAASNTGKVEFFDFRDTKTARERLNSQSLPEFVDFRDVKSATEKLKKQNTEQLPEFGSYKYYENQADEKAKELEEIDKYINDNYSLDDINIWQNAKEGVRDAGENAVKYNSDEKLKGIDNLMSRKADILDDYVGAVACLEAYEGRALKFKEDGSVDTDNVRFVSENQKKRYEVMEKYGGSPAPEYMKTPRQPNEELNGELAAAKGEEEKQTVLKKIDRYQKDMLDPTLNKITETVDKSKKNVAVLNDNIDAANYYDKNKDNKYGDGVFGRIAGNYRIGDIGEERAMSAFNSYAYSDSDLTATQIYDELSRRIQERNKDTFTNTKAWQQNLATIAQYVPQGRNQAIARLKGAAVGSVIPLVGSKTGGDAAAAMYMFKQTAGNMYADLILEEGLSPEEAKKLSANNALWSGVVEYGLESALGGVLKGIGKGVKKIAPTEKVIKVLEKTGLSEEAAKKALSAAKTAGNYAVGIFGEGAEEWIQQGGEIVTKRYAAKGESASALKIAAETFDFSKYTDEDFDEMNEAFKGGAVIGFASTVGSRAAVNLAQSGMDKLAAHSDNKAVGKAALTVSQPDVLINRAIDAGLESSDEKTVGRIQKLADKYKSGNASAAEVGEIIKTGLRTGYEQAQNLKVTEDTQTNDDVALPTQDTARQSVLAAAISGNSVISPSVTAAANVSERQMHDVKENLSEGGAAQSVEQVQNAVKKVTNTMINEFKNSNIKNIPNYQAAYNENLRLSTTKGATIDKDFIKTYANQYAEGLKRNNSKAYKELASVSDDVGSMLTDYLISNRIPQGIGDISALAQAGGELRSIIGKAAQTTLAMNGKIYNDTDRVSAISNEISNGNFAVVDGANDGNIALAKVGEYYEAYGADAVALAKAFNVSTHYIQKNGRKTLVAAVPSKYIGEYAAKLGYSGTQYSAGGNEYIYLTKDAERGNLSADAVRSDITAESDSDFIAEIEKNGMIELDERPSESKIETIAAQVERDNTIPVYLDGVDKLGEVLLVYANEEDVTRNMVKTDINSYYDGVMPERGIPLSENTDGHYDEDTIEISERPSEYDADSYALVVELDRTIPILLNGVDELGEVELNYSNEENVTRDMVKSDIDAYYSGTMPEHGVSLSNNYDPDIKFSVESVDGTDDYSAKEIENWKDSKNIVVYKNETQFNQFVNEVLENKKPDRKMYFGKVGESAAKNIYEKTGVNVRGYNISLKGYEIRKILLNSHGNAKAESMRGQAAINTSDLLKIPEIITSPDYVGLSDKLYNGNKVIEFRKEFDGKTVVISYVSGKHHDLQIQTMYKNIKRNLSELPSGDNSFSHTSKTRPGTVSSIDNISQNDDIVNSNIRENSENDTENVKFSQDNSLDGGGIIRYNDDIDIPYRESKQLREYIMSENNRNGSRLKPSGCKEIGDNFYVWKNNSKTDYDVVMQIEIDGNEDVIDLIRKGFENGETYGINKGTTELAEIVDSVRSDRGRNDRDNARNTAELSNGNDGGLYNRQLSEKDGFGFSFESGRNQQNTEVGNYGRDDILNGNDRRTLSESERERGSGVQEIAGDAEGNAGEEQSSASSRRIYARDVKEAGGVERRNDRGVEADFVKSEYYNDEMRRIAAENDERGVVTHFILGNGRAIEYGTNFRGAVRGNEVYIQADHGKYSPTQINRHEIIHRNYSSDTVQELKNRIKSRLTNEQIRDIAERLYRDYAQKRRSFDEIFEEFVCDVMADMNDYAEMFETETREYWAAEEQDRKGYSPSTYTESIDAGGKNVAENKIEPLAWNSDKKSVHPINAFGSDNNNISQNDNVVNSNIRKNSENDTDIRFSTDENTDVNVSDDEDMSYLSEPVKNIRNDINEVINRADLKKGGKVYDRAAAVRVRDSILDNISIGDIQGIDMRTKKDRAVMTVLVNRALNSAGVDAKRKSARDLTRYIAQNASVYDADSLCADGGVDYEGDRAVILNYIKHGVKISPDAKEAIISAVGENSARGYIAMMSNNSALGIDSVYDELSVALPGYFASDALTEGEKMRRVIDVYTWLKDGKSMQDVKLIDVMTPDDARAFTELVQKQLELAFDTMGRDSAISREIAAERTKYEQRLSDIREKYEAKIADMRNSAKKKQSDGAKAKNISTEQTGNRFKNLAEAAKKYGAIKKGANAVRDIEMPKRIDDNRYVSRFARTMAEAGVTPDESLSEFERDILDGKMTYERITDEEAKKSATDKIMRRGFMQALDDWNEMILSNQRIGKNEMALGQTLYNQCINAKDAQNAMKIAADLANIATQAGQTVQACALIKQMSPDCQLYSLEQSVEKMKREFENKRKFVSGEKRKIDLKINEELAQKLLNAKTEDERRAVMDEILQDIANQIPSTLKDKWDSWRYLSMLGNPRTHIRNIGGNAVFMLPVKVKNAVGWVLEKTISKDKRTKSLKSTKDSKNFAAADYAKMKDIIQGSSGKYEELSKINELRRIYKFKPLEWLRKANFAALEWEDGIFLKHHYVNAMAQFLTARGYTSEFMNSGTKDAASVLENARAYAMSEAQKATYRDANAIAETLSRWQRNLQNNDKLGVRVVGQAVEGIVPFKKTPLNIAKRGVEYSPIGLISGLYDAAANIKSGKVTAAQAIDKIASGLTGTGLVILGMGLSKLGLVRGDDDDDDKLARLDSATGEQSYSFKIGNHSYTIDWVAPASMPFFMGVSMWNAFEKTDKFTFEEILNAVLKIPAPLLNLSVLSSLNDLIRAGDYSSTPTEKMADYAWQATTSYVGQAFPTVMGQITRTVDKTKRNASFTDPDNGLPAGLDRFIARQVTKIPGLSKILEPKIDMWGREETYGDTWYGRLIGNTISPGYYKEINSTALDDELRRLGNEYEGDGSVLPPKAPKYFTYEKQKYYMTPSEYAQYSVIRGQKSFEYADELIRTDDYKNKSAEEKKKALEKCYDAAGDEAKNEILKGRGIDVAAKEAEKAAKKKSKKKTSKKKKK